MSDARIRSAKPGSILQVAGATSSPTPPRIPVPAAGRVTQISSASVSSPAALGAVDPESSPVPASTTTAPRTASPMLRPASGSTSVGGDATSDTMSSQTLSLESEQRKYGKFKRLLSSKDVDLAELKKLTWHGCPREFRASVWKLLLNYLPTNADRRQATVERKREEYLHALPSYFNANEDSLTDYERSLRHQIDIDVPRTAPAIPLFQTPQIQAALGRILYMWAIRHPGSGYVQGINDLATPFFVSFLADYTDGDVMSGEVQSLTEAQWEEIEADTYWCLTKLLDGIQDHYTFAQPGIQKQIFLLRELIRRVDAPLCDHLDQESVQFVQFAFRWFNCLLIREFPLSLIIRMWDTYISEAESFAVFNLYVCAAYLVSFSKQLKQMDFQQLMIFLQNPPTDKWSEDDLESILSQAYLWKALFHDAPSHLNAR